MLVHVESRAFETMNALLTQKLWLTGINSRKDAGSGEIQGSQQFKVALTTIVLR